MDSRRRRTQAGTVFNCVTALVSILVQDCGKIMSRRHGFREHLHLAVEGRQKKVLVPVCLHVEAQDAAWWGNHKHVTKPDILTLLAENMQAIESKYWLSCGNLAGGQDTDTPPGGTADSDLYVMDPSRGQAASSSSLSSASSVAAAAAVGKSSQVQARPTRLEGCTDCVLAYTVSSNTPKYSVLTLRNSGSIRGGSSGSSSSMASASKDSNNMYLENNMSSFAISVW